MNKIQGYKYTTEQEVVDARKSCNDYYGIPVSINDTTQNWVDYQFAELNNPQFYYIFFDESLIPILGQPIIFKVETFSPSKH
jgi:hypothetical protein